MKKEPLCRKVNTTARGVFHRFGANFSTVRRSVNAGEVELDVIPMKKGVRRGLDYTPLFRSRWLAHGNLVRCTHYRDCLVVHLVRSRGNCPLA